MPSSGKGLRRRRRKPPKAGTYEEVLKHSLKLLAKFSAECKALQALNMPQKEQKGRSYQQEEKEEKEER